jgi:hypothetical protein
MTRREFALACGAPAAPAMPAAEGAQGIGRRRELFVDRELLAGLRGVELRPAEPVDAGVALKLDQPWEGAFSTYTTLLADRGRFRMYYRGTSIAKDGGNNEVTCCAESPDGIRWQRPALEPHGNGIILSGQPPFSHNFTPFLDSRPGVSEAERYKAVAGYAKTGLVAFVSSDGLEWKRRQNDPVLPPPPAFSLDSQNIAFWSAHENRYVLFYRTWKKVGHTNYRWISRAESGDFRLFTPTGEMDFGDAPPEQLYTNQTSPYFRAPHIYIGICARFMPGRQVLTEEQAKAIRVNPAYFKDCSDAVLLSSRGGQRYARTFMEAFLRPGVGMENWVSRSNYPALNVVQTGRSTMSFYVNRNYGQPTSYVRRYELRLDGFASAHAGYAGGEAVTKPLIFAGAELELNYSTSAAGGVRVEVQDAGGRAVPGFELANARELIGDEIARSATWKSAPPLASLAGKPVRLRFALKDADLFAFRFKDQA